MSDLEDKYLTNLPEEDVNLPSDEIVTEKIVTISECGGKHLIYDGKEWLDLVNYVCLKKRKN